MSRGATRFVATLGQIVNELTVLRVEDATALASVAATLHNLLQQDTDILPELHTLLQYMIEGLQAVQQRQGDPHYLLEAIQAAAIMAEQFVTPPNVGSYAIFLEETVHELSQLLAETSDGPSPVSAGESFDNSSVDDIAALLLQLEPTDTEELRQVRHALTGLIAAAEDASTYPDMALPLFETMVESLDGLIRGEVEDEAVALEDVTRLLTTVITMIDSVSRAGETRKKTPVAAPLPEPTVAENVPGSEPSSQADEALQLVADDLDTALVGDFLTESAEYIEEAEAALLGLEVDPDNLDAINVAFRAFHTVKGTAGFLGFTFISELAHHAETMLSRMRDREIRCTGGYADLALRSVDMIKELMQALHNALSGGVSSVPAGYTALMQILVDPEAAGFSEQVDTVHPPRLGDILVAEGKINRAEVEAVVATKGEGLLGVALTRSGSVSTSDVARALRTQNRLATGESAVEPSVRVRTDRLDNLIDMIGELVIAHSMVVQDELIANRSYQDGQKKIAHVGKIVRELQDLSMSMRMVPFKGTFQKMTRLVRDVSQKVGKEVTLITQGEETEIDRNMVDVIADPLVHMVRNAVDHGIEPPDVREARGKPRGGTISLGAYHAGGNVVIELQDDGKGMNRHQVVDEAIAKGLIDSDKGMSDQDAFNLVFEPGFSTAEQVTDVSGRGVGMDVVKRSIESLKGRIEILSEPGQGTTFALQLPLTLAITDGMLVGVGSERYIIPTVEISMSFQPSPESLSTVIGRGELVTLRGELIPVVRLYRLFEVEGAVDDPNKGLLVVVKDGERHCAILVDALLGQQQVVAKSLGGLGIVPGISGAAILGDGRVGLILDPAGVASLSRHTLGSDSGPDSAKVPQPRHGDQPLSCGG